MRKIAGLICVLLALTGAARAEQFSEVTVSVPVQSLGDAEVWYRKFLGPNVKETHPVPGVTEFMVAPGVWLQLFETENQQSANSVLRFKVQDFTAAQEARNAVGINTGEATVVPDIVTFSEFSDPDGNQLGFYSLP